MIKLWWKPKYWVKKHHKVAYKRKMPKSLGMQKKEKYPKVWECKKKKTTQKFGDAKKKEKKHRKKNNMQQVLEKIKMVQY